MKTIISIICIIASMFTALNKQATTSDVCNTKLYAMGARCVSVETVDDKTDIVTVENCNGYQFAFEASRYDFFEGDNVSCIMSDMGTKSILDDVVISATYDRYDLLQPVELSPRAFLFAPMFLYTFSICVV